MDIVRFGLLAASLAWLVLKAAFGGARSMVGRHRER
jgi:hypothetical protein